MVALGVDEADWGIGGEPVQQSTDARACVALSDATIGCARASLKRSVAEVSVRGAAAGRSEAEAVLGAARGTAGDIDEYDGELLGSEWVGECDRVGQDSVERVNRRHLSGGGLEIDDDEGTLGMANNRPAAGLRRCRIRLESNAMAAMRRKRSIAV